MAWNWPRFFGETSIAFIKRFKTRINPNDFTDTQVTQSYDIVKQIEECSPMAADLDPNLVNSICKKIKKGRELEARQLIEKAATPEARGWCIDALKAATTMICSCGPTIVKEATYNLLGC